MATKQQLQDQLKQQYGINKNISQGLAVTDCERLLHLLDRESSVLGLVSAFADKNEDLSKNNRQFGQQRSQAQRQLEKTKAEYEELQQSVAEAEARNQGLRVKQDELDKEQGLLEQTIRELQVKNQQLSGTVKQLESKTEALTDVNEELKKDNKALKNLVDQIRLKLAIDIKQLMRYEDSELRKAAVRLFRWTQE